MFLADLMFCGCSVALWKTWSKIYIVIASSSWLIRLRSTGITTAVVEQIERNLKEDVLREVRNKNGKLLLHDELETEPGTFEIVPQWEQVTEEDILTPKEVFELVAKEGFKVCDISRSSDDSLQTIRVCRWITPGYR